MTPPVFSECEDSMGIPITIALLGGLGLMLALSDTAQASVLQGRPAGSKDPFKVIPPSHRGKEFRKEDNTAGSGRRYRTHFTGPDANDDVFVIAQRLDKLFDARGQELGRPWIAYFANRQTGRRRLFRAFAPGRTKKENDRIVTDMMKDFGLVG